MQSQLRAALTVFVLLTLVTGVVYPAVVTLIGQLVFPYQANGSIAVRDAVMVGSELIGQPFDDPRYFWGRPSATSPPYNGAASSGSNLGPLNPALLDTVRDRADAIRKAHPNESGSVPVDLVTASASGLDPHISPAAAQYQVSRVAQARGMSAEAVRQVLGTHTEGRAFGLLGEPRVNVLMLNLELDKQGSEARSAR